MRGQPGFFDIDDRLKRLSDLAVCSKPPEHDADHGQADECNNGGGIAFEVARIAAIPHRTLGPCGRK